MPTGSCMGALHIRYSEWERAGRIAVTLREGHAVVHEHVAVLGRVRVFPAVVAEAVADVEQTAVGKRDRDAGREVADAVLAAEPVGDEADLAAEGLFVAEQHAATGAEEADLHRIVLLGDDAVRAGSESGTMVALHLLADVAVDVR